MSARIGASHEPEQPPAAATAMRPVLETDTHTNTPMTALAEPEPEQIELEDDFSGSSAEAGGAAIVFEDVKKVYEPGVVALDGVSFTIEKGEFVFIVGASGSGKSTLIKLLLKEIEPTEGRILVGGRDLTRLKHGKVPQLRRNVGCVFQDFKLLPSRTAAENVAYALKVQGENRASIRRKVPEVMNMVGHLAPDRRAVFAL